MKNLLLLLLLFFISFNLLSQNISLDRVFGEEGVINEYFKDSTEIIVIDAQQFMDGSYLFSYIIFDDASKEDYFILAKHSKTGQLDTTFADKGYYKISSNDVEELLAFKVLPSGFVATVYTDYEDNTVLTIIDEKGNNFRDIKLQFGNYTYDINSILYRDNSLYIGGNFGLINPEVPNSSIDSSYVLKINDQGSIDTTFAENGIYKYGLSDYTSYLSDMDFQGDKILLSNQFSAKDYSSNFILFSRINSDGELDEDFGDSGAVILDGFYEEFVKIFVDSTGSFYFTLFEQPAVIKFTKEGEIDKSYGKEGTAVSDKFEDDLITFFSQVYDGEAYFFGVSGFEYGLDKAKPIIIKYNAKGELDTLFGDKGIYTQDLAEGGAYYNGLVDDDGKILAFGGTFSAGIDSDNPDKKLIVRYKYNAASIDNSLHTNIRAYIHPNPTNSGRISFDFELKRADKVIIELLDINAVKTGLLYSGKAHVGVNEIGLLLPENIKAGMYFVKLTTGVGYVIKKLVVY